MVKDVIKIICLLLFPVVVHAQTLTFRTEKGWKLDHALLALSQQSGVNIAFNPDDADDITVPARSYANQSIQSIVSDLLKGSELAFRLQGNRLVVYRSAPKRIAPAIPPPPQLNSRFVVSGRVLAEDGTAMPAASIKLKELNQFFTTDQNGNFNMIMNNVGAFTLEISYVGYQQQVRKIENLSNDTVLPAVFLKEVSLRLKDISVTANRTFEGSSNSSLLITREIIEQTPALSVNDLLNQIPNRAMSAPGLQNVQGITLRGTYTATTYNRDEYQLNNSFGVAIVMDGNTISNNMNMQSYNPGYGGMKGSVVTSASGWGLSGSGTTNYTGDYAFSGTDLRQIPPDNIESIEVVSGVASAKYGDLTDGAIIIERQAGISKGYFRTQLRDAATSYSFSKGFRLSPTAGVMNASFSYTNSNFDSREKLKAYQRINGNVIWTNYYGRQKRIKNTTILDYGRNLDGIKKDPDDEASTETRFDSWNFSISNKSTYRVNGNFVKNISLNLRYTEGHQYTYRAWNVNDAFVLYTDATTTGIHEGTYGPGIYRAESVIDGRPVGFNVNLDVSNEFRTGRISHFFTYGGNYNYGRNKGLGQVVDPSRPRVGSVLNTTTGSSVNSDRFYDYSRVVPQQDFGFYAEDVFKTRIADRYFNVRAGARLDVQNGMVSGSPRINTYYEVNKDLRIGLAYGLSYKSPGLAMRYPGPTFRQVPLLNAYNGNAAESKALIYVERFEVAAENLKPANSQTLELSAQYRKNGFNLTGNAYYKRNRNGFNTQLQYKSVTLPMYSATFVEGSQPIVSDTGTRRYSLSYQKFDNSLSSDSRGIELILNTPKIRAIMTSFTFAAGVNTSTNRVNQPTWSSVTPTTTSDDVAFAGLYPPSKRVLTYSNARLTTVTHIPKISLIIQLTTECTLLNQSYYTAGSSIPVAYLTIGGDYVTIDKFDSSNPNYGYLEKTTTDTNTNDAPNPLFNFHMSVGKEIRKRFKLSFNVYNVFNYQPYYVASTGYYTYPNSSPTFGAEFSVKF